MLKYFEERLNLVGVMTDIPPDVIAHEEMIKRRQAMPISTHCDDMSLNNIKIMNTQ
jgi:hypothetical protein